MSSPGYSDSESGYSSGCAPLSPRWLSKRQSCSGSRLRKLAVDLINELPDSLLVHVLSFLPIADAIRTQFLSKRWQYLWTYSTSLLFRDCNPFRQSVDFVTFVDKTLILCTSSKISKLAVEFAYQPDYAPEVDHWTRFATGRGAEELQLDFMTSYYDEYDMGRRVQIKENYLIPQRLYGNPTFKVLEFSNCKMMPKGVVCWLSLKKLSIGYAKLGEDVIQKMLVGSPVLEILELYCVHGFNCLHVGDASLKKLILRDIWPTKDGYHDDEGGHNSVLEISGPHLHLLEVSGNLGYRACWLGDVSSLVDANISFLCPRYRLCSTYRYRLCSDYESCKDMIMGLLQSLVHVKKITLGDWAIQVLSMMDAKGLSSPLLKCEFLTLDTYIGKTAVPGIANILNSSHNLDTLVISLPSYSCHLYFWGELGSVDTQHYWTSTRKSFTSLMYRLQKVKLIGSGLYSCEDLDYYLSFVQFLLKNGRVLHKMVINAQRGDGNLPKEYSQAAQTLLSFPRSSPTAEVLFYE